MDTPDAIDISGNQTTVDWKMNGIPEFHPSSAPAIKVEDELIDQYQNDGAVLLPGLFVDWVSQLRRGLDKKSRCTRSVCVSL